MDDTFSEQNMEDNLVPEEEEDEQNGSELVVLDPTHPLMERVQAALSAQLQRQSEKLEIELREKQETLKSLKVQREELGVNLYGVQQHLARQQMLIEKEQDGHSVMTQLRKQREQTLNEVKNIYQSMQDQIKQDNEQVTSLRTDMETTASRLRYLTEAHDTVQQDIALTMRATEKAVSDVSIAQEDKLQQDLYVDQLTQHVQQLEEQISLNEAQCQAQAQETKAMKETLAEAAMELETLLLEKKKLMHQWNNSLIGMRRRDEAYSAMIAARNVQQQKIHSINTELENYKKSIMKEQEHNEQLTLLLNKIETDINYVIKQIELSTAKKEALHTEYMTYTRTLQETEQTLTVASGECAMKKSELVALRTQIERETFEKRRLEDTVMEKMMQRLTMDKATQYSMKSLEKLHKRGQELEISLANVENEISQASLEASKISSILKRLQQVLDKTSEAIQKQNDLVNKSELEIGHNNALIERKQTQIDLLNKKIEAKVSKLGEGEDLGPLELKIDSLQKQISDSMEQCSQMQQYWLRQQNDLVKKTQEADDQKRDVDALQKEQLILSQKKLRQDGDLAGEEKQYFTIQRSIELLQKDMVRLNSLITDKRGEQNQLEQGNILIEKDFISSLKEAELEFLQLQANVDGLKEEQERLLNSLVESEHQIMLWERKIQLAKEMKESVDSETGQTEVRAMKAEIHRMQVRHSQLMRQQEKMIQDMEKAIYRRETIIQKSDAQTKSGKKDQTQGYHKKKVLETQRKIKQTQKETAEYEQQLEELRTTQTDIVSELQKKQKSSDEAKTDVTVLETEVNDAEMEKHNALNILLANQTRVKHLTAAKDGKYRLIQKNDESRTAEMHRQKEKLQAIWSVTQKLETETHGHVKQQLGSLSNILKSKLQNLQESQQEAVLS